MGTVVRGGEALSETSKPEQPKGARDTAEGFVRIESARDTAEEFVRHLGVPLAAPLRERVVSNLTRLLLAERQR